MGGAGRGSKATRGGELAGGGALAGGAGLTAGAACTTGGAAADGAAAGGAAAGGGAARTGVSCVFGAAAARLGATWRQDFPSVITIRVASAPGATFTHETGAGGSAWRSATAPGAGGAAAAGAVPACCTFWAVAAVFFDCAATATVLDCVTGPSSPGLFTRTETTTFVGCGRVAVALVAAAWSVALSCALACSAG